ncbi:MAG: metal ABC transporter substrate-binding protein [Candidatus Rokuibacteriota bacterium]
MLRLITTLVVVLVVVGLRTADGQAAAKIRVVASISDLKALAEAVGGDLIEVDALARGSQNAHDVEVRPSLMLKLRRADLLVRNGLALDFWVEPLVVGAQNSRIVPGAPGYVDASRGVPIIPSTGVLDRSGGDVHPQGNPHYTLDPALAPIITANIVEGLKRVAPEHAPQFEEGRRAFLARLEADILRWQQMLEPARGAKVVTYHETFTYFLRRFGLEQAGSIEDRPGIPPSPTHLAGLIRTIKEQKVRVIMAEPWADQRAVELVARESGARALGLPSSVGGVRGVDSYVGFFEHNVKVLTDALR